MDPTANLEPIQTHIDCELQVVEIFISAGHDYWTREGAGRLQHGIRSVPQVECVAGRGLCGDRYFSNKPQHLGQASFIALETVEEIRQLFRLPQLPAGIFRRNLLVSGVDLSSLLGQRFQIQGVLFEGSQECRPCHWMDRVVANGAQDFMRENFRGGLRARILSDGVIATTAHRAS